jgi:hypothetical protein
VRRLLVLPIIGVLALTLLMSPEFAAPGRRALVVRWSVLALLVALVIAAIAFWVFTIAELLSRGPGADHIWWLAAVAVVVVLGPIGALAYQLARPTFDAAGDHPARR